MKITDKHRPEEGAGVNPVCSGEGWSRQRASKGKEPQGDSVPGKE